MAQNYSWPSSSQVTVTGSPNGTPIPNNSIVVAGENASGNVEPLQLTSGGALIVSPIAGSTTDVNITQVGGAAISEGQKTSALSLPVVIASDQSTLPISAASLPLPTGASTSALQTTGNSVLGSILLDLTNGTQITQVSNFPATQPISGTVTVVQTAGTNLHADIDSSVLPTGASTSALQSSTQGSVTGGTAATASTLSGGVFNTTLPTLTTGQQAGLQVDSSGRLIISPSGASSSVNISQFGGTAVTLGSKVSASSIPVVIASDQGTLPLPTGAATSANQTNGTQKSQAATPTALTVTQAALTVGTTAVRLTASGSAPAVTRVALVGTPDTASTAVFYIGSSTVTNSGATRGVEIKAGQAFIANNDAGDYWIVSSVAAQTVTVMEQA